MEKPIFFRIVGLMFGLFHLLEGFWYYVLTFLVLHLGFQVQQVGFQSKHSENMTFQKGLNIPKKVYTFQERFKHSPKSPNIPKSLNKTPFYGSPQPREGNLPGKHTFFKCIFTKIHIFGLQTTLFDGINVLMSFLAQK